jgi:hypothetical protein
MKYFITVLQKAFRQFLKFGSTVEIPIVDLPECHLMILAELNARSIAAEDAGILNFFFANYDKLGNIFCCSFQNNSILSFSSLEYVQFVNFSCRYIFSSRRVCTELVMCLLDSGQSISS